MLNVLYHLGTFGVFIAYISAYFSIPSAIYVSFLSTYLVTLYNTVWFHRHCSHLSFQATKVLKVFFLWTNPFFFREEIYVVPHQVHHRRSEKPGDPYGPHLGWLGSYLSIESNQKYNTQISREKYEALQRSLQHVGFPMNSFNDFKKYGSVEKVPHYLLRTAVSQGLYCFLSYLVGGLPAVIYFYAAVFLSVFLIRDFNWRGHGGFNRRNKIDGWEFDPQSSALNQKFYGYFASEWHDCHHLFPMSAKSGFLSSQPDLAFSVILFLKRIGFVTNYIDSTQNFNNFSNVVK